MNFLLLIKNILLNFKYKQIKIANKLNIQTYLFFFFKYSINLDNYKHKNPIIFREQLHKFNLKKLIFNILKVYFF
jgi:hypothetical protein